VQDAQSEPVTGRTNWRRFAVALGGPIVASGVLVIGLAHGAFAASLTLSGSSFKISADSLVADGFSQYSQGFAHNGQGADKGLPKGLAVSGIQHATLINMCQSVHVAGSPFSLVIRAGRPGDDPATADNMMIALDDLSGKAVFTDIEIGNDAATLAKGGDKGAGAAGTFGQQATKAEITNLRQTAYYTAAGKFTLTGLSLKINTDWQNKKPEECY
jgi:hypothetical protein